MKKNRTTRIIVFVLFLAIVTAIIIAGTFARYTSSQDGTGTAEIAKWSFSANGLDSAVTLERTNVTDKIADGKIAPGTKGSFSVGIDATGCEVDVDYKVEISNIQNKPTNLKFYSDEACTNEITETDSKYTIEGTMKLSEIKTTPTKSLPIYWEWKYDTVNGDKKDTDEGILAKSMTFDISVVGTQANPNA